METCLLAADFHLSGEGRNSWLHFDSFTNVISCSEALSVQLIKKKKRNLHNVAQQWFESSDSSVPKCHKTLKNVTHETHYKCQIKCSCQCISSTLTNAMMFCFISVLGPQKKKN